MGTKYSIQFFLKVSFLLLAAGGLLFGYAFFTISRGEAFIAFERWCEGSQNIISAVGNVNRVEMLPFGSFYEKDKGGTGEAGFNARIVGSSSEAKAVVAMSRKGNIWKVETVEISGRKVPVY